MNESRSLSFLLSVLSVAYFTDKSNTISLLSFKKLRFVSYLICVRQCAAVIIFLFLTSVPVHMKVSANSMYTTNGLSSILAVYPPTMCGAKAER